MEIPETCAIFIPVWGSNWGSSGYFRNQNNLGSSSAYITCIYCGLSVKLNTRKTPHGTRRSWTHLLWVCFCVCGRQKPEYPQFAPPWLHDAITQSGTQDLGFPCISVCVTQFWVEDLNLRQLWKRKLIKCVYNSILFFILFLLAAKIQPRSAAKAAPASPLVVAGNGDDAALKSKVGTGKETLRLRAKGPAELAPMVSLSICLFVCLFVCLPSFGSRGRSVDRSPGGLLGFGCDMGVRPEPWTHTHLQGWFLGKVTHG